MRAVAFLTSLVLPAVSALAEASLPDLPNPASSLGAIEADGYLYVYGGHLDEPHTYANETTSGALHRLNLRQPQAKWEELPGGIHVQGMNLAAHKGRVIRVGGMEPQNKKGEKAVLVSTATVQMFDPKAKKWLDLPSLPAPRSSHDVVLVGDKLVVVGGWRLDGKGMRGTWHETALILDLAAAKPTWESIPQPFQRRALTAASLNGKVYVLGGLSATGTSKRVDVLDVATKAWSTVPDYPGSERAGFSPAACVLADRLYLNIADGTILRLNDKADGWDAVGKVAQPRIVHRLVPWEKEILVIGGAGRGGNVATIERISIPADAPSPVSTDEVDWPGFRATGNGIVIAKNRPLK